MALLFKDWFFNQLPVHYHINDSYKDPEGRGLLQRLLRVPGEELDENIVPFIESFTDILDLKLTADKFLPFIGHNLGAPPDIDGTYATYRKLLSYIVAIYRVKGTLRSYKLLFNLLGLDCEILEIEPELALPYDDDPEPFDYDTNYENGVPHYYDADCEPCIEYTIAYWNRNDICTTGTVLPVSPLVLENIRKIICFIQPIDCKLVGLSRTVHYCETWQPALSNEITIEVQQIPTYDAIPLGQYDGTEKYDSFVTTNTLVFTF